VSQRHRAADPERVRAVSEVVARSLLSDRSRIMEAIRELEPVLDEDVVTWTPAWHTDSRDALFAALLGAEDTLAEVRLTLAGSVVEGCTSCVMWQVRARFDNAGFLNDDLLVEPSRGPVECSGVLLLTFEGDLVVSVRCYYDSLSLLEQMLPADAPAPERPSAGNLS
jgi:hypothetical protein